MRPSLALYHFMWDIVTLLFIVHSVQAFRVRETYSVPVYRSGEAFKTPLYLLVVRRCRLVDFPLVLFCTRSRRISTAFTLQSFSASNRISRYPPIFNSLRQPDRFRLFAKVHSEFDSSVFQGSFMLMDPNGSLDENSESKIYIGNLDLRITEAALIKMFSPFGTIVTEDFLWHTRGRKRGEPRGFAFIQYSSKEEARLAQEKMHGRLACGRPMVVRISSERNLMEAAENSSKGTVGAREATKTSVSGSSSGQTSRSSKIAAIKNKLKALEEEGYSAKKQKQADTSLQ